jgi:hypothetical protein
VLIACEQFLHFRARAPDRHRHNFVVEYASCPCVTRELLRPKRVCINHLARERMTVGEILGGFCHGAPGVRIVERFRQCIDERRIRSEGNTPSNAARSERRLRHGLATTDQANIGVAILNRIRTLNHSLESRSAQPVDGEGRSVDAAASAKRHVTRVIARVGRRLKHVAKERRVYRSRGYSRSLDCRARCVDRKIRCGQVLERTAECAEWRANRGKEKHAWTLKWVTEISRPCRLPPGRTIHRSATPAEFHSNSLGRAAC